jgi:uncharacterized protein (DUF488 family)
MNLYTIGFTRKSLQQFLGLLEGAGVTKLVDARLRPTSQLSGFAKRDDLAFLLPTFAGIEYEHEPRLAPTPEILDAYRQSKDWQRYEVQFNRLSVERGMSAILAAAAADHERIALLCSEAQPERCHRRLIAEAFAADHPSTQILHLT